MTAYNMTPGEYQAKWGLKPDYPMVAPNYALKRQELARRSGWGASPERHAGAGAEACDPEAAGEEGGGIGAGCLRLEDARRGGSRRVAYSGGEARAALRSAGLASSKRACLFHVAVGGGLRHLA